MIMYNRNMHKRYHHRPAFDYAFWFKLYFKIIVFNENSIESTQLYEIFCCTCTQIIFYECWPAEKMNRKKTRRKSWVTNVQMWKKDRETKIHRLYKAHFSIYFISLRDPSNQMHRSLALRKARNAQHKTAIIFIFIVPNSSSIFVSALKWYHLFFSSAVEWFFDLINAAEHNLLM